MGRRRMLSENLLYDPEFNSLSIEAQNLFVRMLIKSDDYGILPADQWAMLNLPARISRKLENLVHELEAHGLVQGFIYENKPFFAFKKGRFDEYQSYLIQKRRRSEYLRLDRVAMESEKFQEILGNSWKFSATTPVRHREYRVESKEYRVESKEYRVESKENRESNIESIQGKEEEITNPLLRKIRENFPAVASMSLPLTQQQAIEIQSRFPEEVIIDALAAMENYATLKKKYRSAYLTLNNWCKIRLERGKNYGTRTNPEITAADLQRSLEISRRLDAERARRERGEKS
jgi:hypothetical protein